MSRAGRRVIGWCGVIGLLCMVSACGMVLVPDASQGGRVDVTARRVTKEDKGVQVTVQSMAWQYEPYDLDNLYTPLLVFVRNETDQPIPLQYRDFVLVDDRGTQYDVVPPQTAEFTARSRLPRYAPSYAAPYGYGAVPPPFLYNNGRATDITLLGLTETSVRPHAQVRGFLYFQQAMMEGRRLTLTVSLAGHPQEFQFSIQR